MDNQPIRQRTLIVCSRGVSHQQRHIMADLARLLPHSKKEAKLDRKTHFSALNDLAEMHSCNNIVYLEGRKKIAFLWIANYPNGPSVKFLLQNIHTSDELRLTGNCLRSSRPILSFDNSFKEFSHLRLIQQLLIQTFSTPKNHPKAMPFIDHVFSFSHTHNKIFFRNFEIAGNTKDVSLAEIGPRFVITPIKILDGMVSGETLYKNGEYLPPSKDYKRPVYEDRLKKKNKRAEFVSNPEELSIKDVFG
jgi:ribosome biogenesis protein BRX1